MIRKIARLTTTICVIFSIALADTTSVNIHQSWESYNPNWEVSPQNPSAQLWNIQGRAGIGGGFCGLQNNAFYNLAMQISNLDSVFSAIMNPSNVQGLALAAALYVAGTYFPIIKEAMVGADAMAKSLASLTGLSCNSAMNFVNNEFKATSRITRACVLKRLGFSGYNIFNATGSAIQKAIETKGQDAVQQALDYCMNHATIMDVFNGTDIQKFFDKYDPRKWIACDLVKHFQSEGINISTDANGNYVIPQSTLVNGIPPIQGAELILTAALPEFHYNSSGIQPSFVYVQDPLTGQQVPLNQITMRDITKHEIEQQLGNIFQQMPNSDWATIKSNVDALNQKYGIAPSSMQTGISSSSTTQIDGYFLTIWSAIHALPNLPPSVQATLQAGIANEEKLLTQKYYLLARKQLDEAVIEQANLLKKKIDAKVESGQTTPCG